jgi:hypothetical protein
VAKMATINDILNTIKKAVGNLGDLAATKQQPLFKEVMGMLKRLDTRGDTLRVTLNNLKIINELKTKVEKIVIDPRYKSELRSFGKAYQDISELQNEYFASFNVKFKPKNILKVLTKTAIETTINNLTETGLQVGVTDGIRKMLSTNINAGGSYAALTEQLRNYVTTTDKGNGALERYVRTFATTSINQFSAEYSKTIASDLNLEWYMYTGSLLTTSRDFCIHGVDKRFMHVSEFPTLLEGNFGEYGTVPIYNKTGLPHGMMEGTNPDNFPRRRGGWNCGHQLIAVDDAIVPTDVKDKVYNSSAYKYWATKNGKTIKKPSYATNII